MVEEFSALIYAAFVTILVVGFCILSTTFTLAGPDHLKSIIILCASSIAVFHLALFLLAGFATDKTLKGVDYLVIGLAMFGVLGVVDVQDSVVRGEIPHIMAIQGDRVRGAAFCKPSKPEETSQYCWDEAVVLEYLKPSNYHHGVMRIKLQELRREVERRGEPREVEFYNQTVALYNRLDKEVFQYVNDDEFGRNLDRLWWFYIVGLAASLRLAKVSAEIFEWHKPRRKESDTRAKSA